jgi:general secretion pathway protein F
MSATVSLTLEDIQHLSEEVHALVKAGLPLERHLAAAGSGRSQRLKVMTESIAAELQTGKPLQQVVAAHGDGGSRMLAAAIAAGVRSGNLSTTIETMGDFAKDLVDLRRRLLSSLAYPALVVAVAWIMVALFLQTTLDRIYVTGLQMEIPFHPILRVVLRWNSEMPWLHYLLPVLCGILSLFWIGSGRASAMVFRGPELLILLLPGIRPVIRDLRFYTMSRILSVLIEKEVPLPDALRLAGAVSGNRGLDLAGNTVADAIENGATTQLPRGGRWKTGQLPPMLFACLQNAGDSEQRFLMRLRGASDLYRSRVEMGLLWVRSVLPVSIFLIVGGGTMTMYAASVFWPVLEIYRNLGQSTL